MAHSRRVDTYDSAILDQDHVYAQTALQLGYDPASFQESRLITNVIVGETF